MVDNIYVPPQLKPSIRDRFDGMDPQRCERFSEAMNGLNAHLSSLTDEERTAFFNGIEELHNKTRNGEPLTAEDLEAVAGGAKGWGWAAVAGWVAENLDWQEFKQGVVDAWNET